MQPKKMKDITIKEHVEAITNAIPNAHTISFEVRVVWDTKLGEYVINNDYNSILLRFTVRKPKES